MISCTQRSIFDISRDGTLEEITKLYNKDSKIINLKNENGYTPLILSCYNSNLEIVKFLVNKVEDINGSSDYGTPLMAAVVKGNVEITKLLLEKNADPNIKDANGTTAAHYAVMFKNYDIVELLVASKADFNVKNVSNQTPLNMAALYKDEKLNKLLKL